MFVNYEPFVIIISSPSGAGKTTVCKMIIEKNPTIKLSISATTRPQRPNEVNGKDYHFITKEQFLSLKNSSQFLEDAQVFNHFYGSYKKTLNDEINNSNCVLFDIDWQGARQIKSKLPSEMVISIFILPPSLKELERRLLNRAQDSQEVVEQRMQQALDEISHYHEYDFVIVNDDLNESLNKINWIIETKKINRQNISQLLTSKIFLNNND
jgi:guanylate kinase